VICPLCETRRAKRACPALGQQICAVCCGTKRLVEIHCPSDCPYLATAREHPAAAVVRQQQRDVSLVMQSMRDFSERQSQLFLLLATFLTRASGDRSPLDARGPAPFSQAVIDDDVVDAMRALASTYETSVRGVIYDHHPASLPAQRLVTALKPLLAEAGKGSGTAFERDAAFVLRRIEQTATDVRALDAQNRRAFLELLARVLPKDSGSDAPQSPAAESSRLIVP
jgi:hypothetical protein